MGEYFSKQPAPAPTPAKRLTDRPWREPSGWDKQLEQKLIGDIKEVIVNQKTKPNLLLSGPVGAGKSSFINAVLSIGKDRKVEIASTGGGEKSYTTCYDKYTETTLLQNVRLRDCMGTEQSDNEGFHVKDIVALLKGHVMDGYQFNPRSPIEENSKYYRKEPKFEHQTHCVVFVVDTQTITAGIPRNYVRKIRELQDEVKRLRIPRVLILTKADKLCREVGQNIGMLFRSVQVKEAVATASEVFNIPPASIHPVINYEDTFVIDFMRNIPLLFALRQMMQYAEDRADFVLNASNSDNDESA